MYTRTVCLRSPFHVLQRTKPNDEDILYDILRVLGVRVDWTQI